MIPTRLMPTSKLEASRGRPGTISAAVLSGYLQIYQLVGSLYCLPEEPFDGQRNRLQRRGQLLCSIHIRIISRRCQDIFHLDEGSVNFAGLFALKMYTKPTRKRFTDSNED